MESTNSERRIFGQPAVRLICVLLALVTVALYWPAGRYEFNNFDDAQYITGNANVQGGFSLEAVKWAFTTAGYAGNWHPLTWLSHMLDVELFGLNAGGHHLMNVAFHIANTLLLFLLLRRLTGAIWRAAFVAGLFAWHPMHVESVAWVAERKDVLSGMFWMLTLFAYTKYANEFEVHGRNSPTNPDEATRSSPSPQPSPPGEGEPSDAARKFDVAISGSREGSMHARQNKSKAYYALALVLFALGLMAKPMLVSLPLVMLLLDYWPLRRICDLRFTNDEAKGAEANPNKTTFTKLVVEKIPFFVLSAASCVVTFIAQQRGEAVQSLAKFPVSDRLANVAVAYIRYLGKMVWPTDLAVLYPLSRSEHHPLAVAGAVALLIAICAAVVLLAKSHPPLIVGWLWFVIMLVPVIGLVQVGGQAMADRYTYLPSIGLFIILAWEVPAWLSTGRKGAAMPRSRIALATAAGAILCACVVTAAHQLRYWRDSVTLFTRALAVTKDNYVAEENLGLALAERGQTDAGISHERAALTMFPGEAVAENALGKMLSDEHKDDEAVPHFIAALKSRPRYDQPYYNLGVIYMNRRRFEDAAAQFRTAIGINPQSEKAIANLGMTLAQEGRVDEAMAQYRRALAISAGDAYAHNALGAALEGRNQLEEAVAEYSAAVASKPDFVEARDNLGMALIVQRQYPQAEEQFAAALKFRPDSAAIHCHLGNARLYQGNFQEAADEYTESLRRQPEDVEANFNFGQALAKLGRSGEAIKCYRTVLRVKPDMEPALQKLAWLLATDADEKLRNGTEAVALALRATQLAPNDAVARDTLAAAQAETGRSGDAVISATKALELTGNRKDLAKEIQRRLALYQAGKAFHQAAPR